MKKSDLVFSIHYTESIDGGYVGFIAEVPGAMSQGETIAELSDNLRDAVKAIFEANRYSNPVKIDNHEHVLQLAM